MAQVTFAQYTQRLDDMLWTTRSEQLWTGALETFPTLPQCYPIQSQCGLSHDQTLAKGLDERFHSWLLDIAKLKKQVIKQPNNFVLCVKQSCIFWRLLSLNQRVGFTVTIAILNLAQVTSKAQDIAIRFGQIHKHVFFVWIALTVTCLEDSQAVPPPLFPFTEAVTINITLQA
jgi:hypothetical protein